MSALRAIGQETPRRCLGRDGSDRSERGEICLPLLAAKMVSAAKRSPPGTECAWRVVEARVWLSPWDTGDGDSGEHLGGHEVTQVV
jgi:hypothetical protein